MHQKTEQKRLYRLTQCFSSVQLHHMDYTTHLPPLHLHCHWLPSVSYLQPYFLTVAALLTSVLPHCQQSSVLSSALCFCGEMQLHQWRASIDLRSTLMNCDWHQPTNSMLNQSLLVLGTHQPITAGARHTSFQPITAGARHTLFLPWTWSSALNVLFFSFFHYFSVIIPRSKLNSLALRFQHVLMISH